LNGAQIRNNDAHTGGGVYVSYGSVTLSDGGILSNTSEFDGAGVYLESVDATFIQSDDGTIAYNSTTRSGSSGGGIYAASGSVTLSGGQIVSNSANYGGGGVYVYNWDATLVQGGDSTIAYNSAYDYGGGVYAGNGSVTLNGGQIHDNSADEGGGIYADDGDLTLNAGQVHDNIADTDGGGIYAGFGSVTLNGGQIRDNDADYGDGGGVYNWWANVTLNGAEILSNTANLEGGGVYVYQNTFVQTGVSTIAYNSAGYGGGGVYVAVGDVTLSGGQIISNSVPDYGGGVHVGSAATLVQTGTSTIAYNSARYGGGVCVSEGNATLSGGQIANNSASTGGGGLYVYEAGSATLNGGQIISNSADYHGGGVYLGSDATFVQTGVSTITHNAASDYGGGVYVIDSGSATLNGGQIVSNTASRGGGVHVESGSVTLGGGQIVDNSATGSGGQDGGGGVYLANWDSTLNVSAGQITGNVAEFGGGVYVGYGTARLNGGQIISNSANMGGGLYVDNGNAEANGGQIVGNFAGDRGGGMLIQSGSATLSQTQITHNTGDWDGGGICNNNGTLDLTNVTLGHNTANNGSGGALYNQDGSNTLIYVTVVSNTAGYQGDGLRRVGGTVTLQNTIVAHNGDENCNGWLDSNGHNLDSDDTCSLIAAGDQRNTDPLIGPLADNGGDTLTHALLPGSPAIDTGVCLAGITTDQRGEPRPNPVSSFCDIGAYESGFTGVTDLVITKTVAPTSVIPGAPLTYTLIFSNSGAAGAFGVVITDVVPVSVTVQGVISSGVSVTRTGNSTFTWRVSDLAQRQGGVIRIVGTLNLGIPAGDFDNTATITSTAPDTDTNNNSSSAMVTVENVAPVADDASLFTDEDTPLHGTLPASDDNGTSDTLTFGIAAAPAGGTVAIGGTGSFVYTPTANLYGDDFFTYVVTDSGGLSDSGTVTVHVNAVNDAPTLDAISGLSIDEDAGVQTVGLSGIGTGAANEAQTLSVSAASTNTALVPNPAVVYTSPNVTGSLSLEPVADHHGTATVVVTVSDGISETSRTFPVTVNPVNDAPTEISLSSTSVAENQPAGTTVGDLTTADVDAGDTFTYALVPGPGDADNASFAIVDDALRTGETFDYETRITYTVRVSSTDSGGLSYARIFTITVTDANDAPVAVDDSAVTLENTAVTVHVLDNDADEDTGDTLTVIDVGAPTSGTVSISASTAVVYTPTASLTGSDVFTYAVSDGDQTDAATVTVTVAAGDALTWVDPATGATLVYTGVQAGVPVTITIVVPGGAVTDAIALVFNDLSTSSHAPPAGFGFTDVIFVLDAYLDAVLQPGFEFNAPITLTLEYAPDALSDVDETTLELRCWNGSEWSSDGIGEVEHDVANHRLIVTIDHLTEFALLGQTASLSVFKTVEGTGEGANSTANLPPGGVVTYTITISNGGGGIASNVVMTDPLPPGVSFGAWVVTGSAQLPPPGDTVAWGPHDVLAGESYAISFRGIVTSGSAFAGETITNTAYFSSANAGAGTSNAAVFSIVPHANTPPDISDIDDQSTCVNVPIVIPFTIEDAETAPDDLYLSVESSNATLVPTTAITFAGLGVDRSVTITPAASLTGTSTITITVSDGEYADSTAFVLTVEPRRIYLPLALKS
jgi:uncharacterized repeat protein (TIGR01451 family)